MYRCIRTCAQPLYRTDGHQALISVKMYGPRAYIVPQAMACRKWHVKMKRRRRKSCTDRVLGHPAMLHPSTTSTASWKGWCDSCASGVCVCVRAHACVCVCVCVCVCDPQSEDTACALCIWTLSETLCPLHLDPV